MKKRLPYEISEYINDHYREDFLFLLKDVKEVAGEKRYTIELTKDNYIHTLHFNEGGELIHKEVTQTFPSDPHNGSGFGTVPE